MFKRLPRNSPGLHSGEDRPHHELTIYKAGVWDDLKGRGEGVPVRLVQSQYVTHTDTKGTNVVEDLDACVE